MKNLYTAKANAITVTPTKVPRGALTIYKAEGCNTETHSSSGLCSWCMIVAEVGYDLSACRGGVS